VLSGLPPNKNMELPELTATALPLLTGISAALVHPPATGMHVGVGCGDVGVDAGVVGVATGGVVAVADGGVVGDTGEVGLGGGVLVGVPQAPPAVTVTSSIHQPVAATELSFASRNLISTFCPDRVARFTVVFTNVVPLGLPVHACLPAIGLPNEVEIVPLYPLVRINGPASVQVVPPLVEYSSTPPSNVLSRFQLFQKDNTAPGGTAIGLMVVRYWSVMLVRSGAKAECVPVWAAVVTLVQPQPPGTQVATLDANVPNVPPSNPSLNSVFAHVVADAVTGGEVAEGVPGGGVLVGVPHTLSRYCWFELVPVNPPEVSRPPTT
jgi:hypothetical protein